MGGNEDQAAWENRDGPLSMLQPERPALQEEQPAPIGIRWMKPGPAAERIVAGKGKGGLYGLDAAPPDTDPEAGAALVGQFYAETDGRSMNPPAEPAIRGRQ